MEKMSVKISLLYVWSVWLISTVIFLSTRAAFIPYAPCGENTLEPCRNHSAFPGSIMCENVQDLKTFVQVLRCNRFKNMQEVFLVKSSIDYLPVYIMDFCGFHFLNLRNVVMNKFLEGDDIIHLEQLHLDSVTIRSSWSWEPLAIMVKLVRLSVMNMHIEVLNETLLDHLNENIQSFILTSTNTTAVSSHAFQKFKNLAYLSIQNNEIAELKRSMFPIPSKIKYLYLGKNKITSLPDDIFQEMPDLRVVALEGNLLSELHEHAFRNIWNHINYVLLEGNPLKCSCKMLWLAKRFTPPVFKGECYAPKINFGKDLKDLLPSDFHCF